MKLEKTRLKLKKLNHGELIGLVSRSPRTGKLYGVREKSHLGKQICVLSDHLKGRLKANTLYEVSVKPMRNGLGYVIVTAELVRFPAHLMVKIIPNDTYRIEIVFGNKTIYFDPLLGRTLSSNSIDGVIDLIENRNDIENKEKLLEGFLREAGKLLDRMIKDGVHRQYTCKC